MNISPLDIRKKEFSKKVKGFDKDEVAEFLDMVADEYETVLNNNRQQAKKIETLETKLKDYKQMESTLQDAMINAKKSWQRG